MPLGDRRLNSLVRLALAGGLLPQLAGRPARLRDGRDGMFENQLLLRARFHNQRKLVKALNSPQQFRAVDQIDRDRDLFPPREIEETVLNILWRWL
ncbi:MAG: hypothetical protein QOH70_3929 [Blastocatellia bacterium]|nr:hypothetical protein [Blastocatellia bacterium]